MPLTEEDLVEFSANVSNFVQDVLSEVIASLSHARGSSLRPLEPALWFSL